MVGLEMDAPGFMSAETVEYLWQMPLSLAGGLLIGLAFFASLRRVTADYLGGNVVRGAALQLLRLGLLIGVLFVLMRIGIPVLLAFVAGLVIARQIILRRERARQP